MNSAARPPPASGPRGKRPSALSLGLLLALIFQVARSALADLPWSASVLHAAALAKAAHPDRRTMLARLAARLREAPLAFGATAVAPPRPASHAEARRLRSWRAAWQSLGCPTARDPEAKRAQLPVNLAAGSARARLWTYAVMVNRGPPLKAHVPCGSRALNKANLFFTALVVMRSAATL